MPGTHTQHEEMQAAYRAWRKSTDEYDARIQSIIRGEPHDKAAMQANIDEMARTLKEFTRASEPFTKWI